MGENKPQVLFVRGVSWATLAIMLLSSGVFAQTE